MSNARKTRKLYTHRKEIQAHPDYPLKHQWTYEFENGHCISIILGKTSIGGKSGLFEVCDYAEAGEIQGHLTFFEVAQAIQRVRNRPLNRDTNVSEDNR